MVNLAKRSPSDETEETIRQAVKRLSEAACLLETAYLALDLAGKHAKSEARAKAVLVVSGDVDRCVQELLSMLDRF